jgi:hypothetical protein
MTIRDSWKRLAAGPHQTHMADCGQEGGVSAMRTFFVFVLMLLFMALGALEVVASRAVPLP